MRQVMCFLLAVMLAAPIAAFAEVPSLLNYQGLLKDSDGEILPDGNYSVTFRIWNAETDGNTLWVEGRLVEVENGLFTVLLGSVVPIPDSTFNNPGCWLGVQIGLDPEMTPRSRLVTVPYACEASHADKADTAFHSLDKTIDAGELTEGSLDHNRFSAYDDLALEGKIGDQAGQVAAGDHVHSGMPWNHVDVVVFSGQNPLAIANLNLSDYVGVNRALVLLKVKAVYGHINWIYFKTKGETSQVGYIDPEDHSGRGISGGSAPSGNIIYVMAETNEEGKLEWTLSATPSATLEIHLIGYLK